MKRLVVIALALSLAGCADYRWNGGGFVRTHGPSSLDYLHADMCRAEPGNPLCPKVIKPARKASGRKVQRG